MKSSLTKTQIIDYLQTELASLKSELDTIQTNHNKLHPCERVGIALEELNKIEDKYYHFWMVCNDLGVIQR